MNPELSAIATELAERRRLVIAAARVSTPPYVREAIGERPEEPRARHRWEHGLQEIERYRQSHGVNDGHRALGAEPRSGFERAAFERAQNRIAQIQRELGRTQLTRELDRSVEISA